jgi:AbrB family looped-hinge helix DNA binding protein
MPIVTVKNKFQVVIPQALREQLGISPVDVLEAKAERGRLAYTPKAVIDRIPAGKAERERFFKKLSEQAPGWLKETRAAPKQHRTDKLTIKQIDAEVAAVCRRSAKSSRPAR